MYLINYDLYSPIQKYQSLIRAIRSCGRCIPVARSCLALDSNMTATQIRDHLLPFMDNNDILFVCEIGCWASLNLSQETASWINN